MTREVRNDLEKTDLSENGETQPTFVVGVGASAGGLEALETFFDAIPQDTGMTFVVVQHLSPDFKSLMDQLIRRHTEMPVFRVEDGMEVRRNSIYLIPPKKEMMISNGRLLLTDKDPNEALTLPIDHFFRSLANDCGPRAIAVVLSGSGSDGSRGILDVHDAGGFVIAQDESSAAFDSMPNSARNTGIVDIVGDPLKIAQTLLRLADHPMKTALGTNDPDMMPEDGIKKILRELRDAYGIDFSYYKPATVIRRIERRLLLNNLACLDDYVDAVTQDSEELNRLYKDMLIGVTQFFRDEEAFRIIEEQLLPELLLKLSPEQEVRMWVAGCATGEEPYSLAILLHERLSAMKRAINVRIFATDVHRQSIDTAANGVYDEAAVAKVSPQRLARYFVKIREGYKVLPELRNMVVYATHNLIKDAPFTRLDFISCRNLLIYFQPLAQKKALSLFHFGLKTGGVLLLGPSETTGELEDEFDTINAQWRLFRKRRDIRLSADLRLPTGGGNMPDIADSGDKAHQFRRSFPVHAPVTKTPAPDRELMGIYDELLDSYMPPSILIDDRHELVHAFGSVSDLLRVPVGRASATVLDMLPPDLRTVVVGAIQHVNKTGETFVYNQVRIQTPAGSKDVKVVVKPVTSRDNPAQHMLIEFNEAQYSVVTLDADPITIDDVSRSRIEALEADLRHSRESLQATIEELGSSNEELQATNEELVASNEEMQSTNEELHSVNEELYTVNGEYQKKIGELTEATGDMDNLLNSTDVHTLFLDDELCIRKFTPRMADVFNLIPADIGRKIEGFTQNIHCDQLIKKLSDVFNNGQRHEEEIHSHDGCVYLLRILPYRGETNRAGVVMTLLDVTESRHAEAMFRGTFDNVAVGIAHIDLSGRLLRVNQRLCEILDYNEQEMLNKSFTDLTHPEDVEISRQKYTDLIKGRIDRFQLAIRVLCSNGSQVWSSVTVSLQLGDEDEPQYCIAVIQDISKRKAFEKQLSNAVQQRDRFLAILSHELRNPLAAIVNAASILNRSLEENSAAKVPCGVIRRQSSQMASLLDDLLDVARITQGKIELHFETVNLIQLAHEAVEAVSPLVNKHKHHLKLETSEMETLWVKADPTRMLQIIENLLTNAVKYTPDGGHVTLEIAEESGESDQRLAAIRVRDDGRGLASELLESIFDMFVQSDDTLDRSEGGMGLGLTLVRSLVHLHHGTIKAYSDGIDQGSEFVIRLAAVGSTGVPKPKFIKRVDAAVNLKIVLVEDNDDAREMTKALLELDGYKVHTAADGIEGLEKILEIRPDVVLLDIGLPGLDGFQVAQRVREEMGEDICLVAVTGYGQSEDVHSVFGAGFNHHLVKPIKGDQLENILQASSVAKNA